MAHIALYRTWRPQLFQDVYGQKHIVRTLQNSLKEGRLSHAYLFNGPRGTGKTTTAKVLAKAVNCEQGPSEEPCNECSACKRITDGSVMDVVELDAASNRGVDEIRDIRDKVKYAPTEVRMKVYIIDEVHMLTAEAFNALLKTLEEPPAHVMFILATTEPHKLPLTIISRCQRFDFRRVSMEEQMERLEYVCRQENVTADKEALEYIARLSEGGMRDALSLLDQIVSYSGNRITYDSVVAMTGDVAADQFKLLAQAIQSKDIGGALRLINDFMADGKSADKCMESLIHYFRDLLMIKLMPNSAAVTDRIIDQTSFLEISAALDKEQIFHWIDILNHYQVEMKYSAQPQTLFEVAMMKICSVSVETTGTQADSSKEIAPLKQKLLQLEQQVSRLLSASASTGGGAAASSMSAAASQAFSGAGGGKASSSTAPSIRRSSLNLEGYLQNADSDAFKQLLPKWNQVLAQVKDQKITVHAWLVNGEPVSLHEGTVLLVFKSAMHRETTEKPANRQLIEQVMSEVFGSPIKMATTMQKDWKDAQDNAALPEVEVIEGASEETGVHKEEWINQAIQLFGDDIVKIRD